MRARARENFLLRPAHSDAFIAKRRKDFRNLYKKCNIIYKGEGTLLDGSIPSPFIYYEFLLGIGDRSSLTNNGNLHLTRIGHLVLNLGGNFTTECFRFVVVHLVCSNNDT